MVEHGSVYSTYIGKKNPRGNIDKSHLKIKFKKGEDKRGGLLEKEIKRKETEKIDVKRLNAKEVEIKTKRVARMKHWRLEEGEKIILFFFGGGEVEEMVSGRYIDPFPTYPTFIEKKNTAN